MPDDFIVKNIVTLTAATCDRLKDYSPAGGGHGKRKLLLRSLTGRVVLRDVALLLVIRCCQWWQGRVVVEKVEGRKVVVERVVERVEVEVEWLP